MFFTNQFKLEAAAMDGTRRRTLIDTHTHQVSGVVGMLLSSSSHISFMIFEQQVKVLKFS